MKRVQKLATAALLIAVVLGGSRVVRVEAGADHSAAGGGTAQTPSFDGGSGKVLETMDSGGYTYVRADIGGTAVWAAAPQLSVQLGDVVVIPTGAPMANYYSKTLDRTFDVVYFVPSITVQKAGGTAPAPLDAHGGHAPSLEHGGSAAARPASVPISGIKRADGGKTVEEIFQQKAALAGTLVAVRGKVVKVNLGIMGRNWLHLQDGSGAPGTNDLVVTADGAASVGDTVLAKGTVSTNKDFGAGYTYDVILEGATVTKE